MSDTSYKTKIDDNVYVVRLKNGSSFMVSKEVEEHLKLRGMTPPPVQEFMGMRIICSTPAIDYLNKLYDSSEQNIQEDVVMSSQLEFKVMDDGKQE